MMESDPVLIGKTTAFIASLSQSFKSALFFVWDHLFALLTLPASNWFVVGYFPDQGPPAHPRSNTLKVS